MSARLAVRAAMAIVLVAAGTRLAGAVFDEPDAAGPAPSGKPGPAAAGGLIEGLQWRGDDRSAITTGLVSNTSSLNDATMLFEAGFLPLQWSGFLRGRPVNGGGATARCAGRELGAVCSEGGWDAAALLSGQHWDREREILSYDPASGQGIAFRWEPLSMAQQARLARGPASAGDSGGRGPERLQYLRGDTSKEGAAALAFRQRRTPLGDIVNSRPVYVGPPDSPYEGLDGYPAFRRAHAGRPAMIYVGANDGMLHGFDAARGHERIAFVPGDRRLFSDLPLLTEQGYVGAHRFLVDGPIAVADVHTAQGWKSLLVGGLGAGGQTVYALDVTSPTRFAETAAADLVLWQFSDEDDPDMGYSYARPSLVRMHDGRFAVLLANGYFSGEGDDWTGQGRACLFLLSVDGPGADRQWELDSDYHKLCAPAPRTPGVARYTGLSSPTAVDLDADLVVDTAYAGDLEGQLWRFDLSAPDSAQWRLAHGAQPLFQACAGRCEPSTVQPISTRPEVGPHPLGRPSANGVLLYFGTGQDFMTKEHPGRAAPTQSFYMVYDQLWGRATATPARPPVLPLERAALRRQEILQQSAVDGGACSDAESCLRVVSDHSVELLPVGGAPVHRGWYLDLQDAEGTRGEGQGEQATEDPQLRGSRIAFTSSIPAVPGCRPCGDGWLWELEFHREERATAGPLFDADGDGRLGRSDLIQTTEGRAVASGMRASAGLPQGSLVLTLPPEGSVGTGDCADLRYLPDADGALAAHRRRCDTHSGRLTWRQIR